MNIDKLLTSEVSSTPPASMLPTKHLFSIEQIREELQKALQSNFDFTGNFYLAERQATAPNPCLNLDRFGPIGLPLNERDARAIIELGSLAPFGKKDQTIVDTHVRNTWEIEPANIKSENPAWQKFVDEVVVKKVCAGLGVPGPLTGIKCELYKLLLYETGSHFLPHQDTEKAKGMFATVIIVLPSAFTGGQLHLQHAGHTEVVDMSSDSNFTTSVLAWYTDVMHEVKPITSGYRLALSYNLFYTSSATIPKIPGSIAAASTLRTVLGQWSTSVPPTGECNVLVNLLKHEYTEANLKTGLQSLKGEDAHLMAHLKPILDEFGFSAFLSQISYHLSGPSASGPWNDDYYGSGKRGRYGYYDEEEEDEDEDGEGPVATPTPSQSSNGESDFIEVENRELRIDNMFDLQGKEIEIVNDPIEIEDIHLIPKDPFSKVRPDEVEDEGYTGNEGGTCEHWYRRTGLVLVPDCSVDEVMFSSAGFDYALSRLDMTNPAFPTARERKAIDAIVEHIVGDTTQAATMMADYAVQWNDLEMWRKIVKNCFDASERLGVERLVQAWKTFGFSNVKSSFGSLMTLSHRSLKSRMDTLHALVGSATGEEYAEVDAWRAAQEDAILASFQKPCAEDIPILISAGIERGSLFLHDVILPQLAGKTKAPFEVLLGFVKTLHEDLDKFSDPQSSSTDLASTQGAVGEVVGKCLEAAWEEWDKVIAPSDNQGWYQRETASRSPATVNLRIDRLITLVDVSISINQASRCDKLKELLPQSNVDKRTHYRVLLIPLCKKLIPVLQRHKLKITSPPFDTFFRSISEKYLDGLLPLPQITKDYPTKKFGCNCEDCKSVNTFLSDAETSERLFRMAQYRRKHIEDYVRDLPELVTFTTITTGNPHGVQITKKPDFVASQKRKAQIVEAGSFLRVLGTRDEVVELLGWGIRDIQVVLREQFPLVQVGQPKPAATSSKPTVPVAGQKRKKTVIKPKATPVASKDLGLIDLTMSD